MRARSGWLRDNVRVFIARERKASAKLTSRGGEPRKFGNNSSSRLHTNVRCPWLYVESDDTYTEVSEQHRRGSSLESQDDVPSRVSPHSRPALRRVSPR